MKILLVYNAGDEVKFFGLTDPTDDQLEVLKLAHGNIINYEMPDENQVACDKLSQALSKPENLPTPDGDLNILYEDYASIWVDKEIPLDRLNHFVEGPWDSVYYSGFSL